MDKFNRRWINPENFGNDNVNGINYKIESEDILLDIKQIIKDYYLASFTANSNCLKLCFNNGQKFILMLNEISGF